MVVLVKISRIIAKALVWSTALFSMICACFYWANGIRPSAISLVSFALLAFVFVLKDHSEDFIRNKARNMVPDNEKDLFENAAMLIVYLSTLALWTLSVAASSWLKP